MELNAIFNNYPTLVKTRINMFFSLKCKIEGLGLLNFMRWTQTSILFIHLKKGPNYGTNLLPNLKPKV
jgi:hypothetical protein